MLSIGSMVVAVPLLITRASVKSRLTGQTEKCPQLDFPILVPCPMVLRLQVSMV